MSPIQQKINNSYESEPSSGNSNGSSIDTLTMGNHDLDMSPKLNTLLAHSAAPGTPQTPTTAPAVADDLLDSLPTTSTARRTAVSEAADRERVELAKIYFQRVFAESQHQLQARPEFGARTPTTTTANHDHSDGGVKPLMAHGFRSSAVTSSSSSSSSSSNNSSSSSNSSCSSTDNSVSPSRHAQHAPCFSSEISDQDEKCRQQLHQQQQLGQPQPTASAVADDADDDLTTASDNFSIQSSSTHDHNASAVTRPVSAVAGALAADIARAPMAAPYVPQTSSVCFAAENSCNAVDHRFAATTSTGSSTATDVARQVSFDGCIRTMSAEHEQKLSMLQASRSSFMQANNEQSPDLFEESDDGDEDDDDDDGDDDDDVDDDDDDLDADNNVEEPDASNAADANSGQIQPTTAGEVVPETRAHILASEKTVLGRIQTSLAGLLPPPSVTILQYDILEMLSMYKQNSARLAAEDPPTVPSLTCVDGRSEFRPTHTGREVELMQWPYCQDAKAHGLLYNRSECSENIELLCMRYAERNIGAETSSTFTVHSPSSCKKRSMRMKQLAKSPGNRLSHLARRRAIFSSANLLNKSATNEASTLGKNQMIIDTRSRDRRSRGAKVKTPKRRTPGGGARKRTPGRKTPGSSRKRLLFAAAATVGASALTGGGGPSTSSCLSATIKPVVPATRETSKRALFQSPPQEKPRPQFPADVAHRVERSKRVLFSPLPPSHRKAACVPQTPDSDAETPPSMVRSASLSGGGSALRKQLSFGSEAAICENSSGTGSAFQMPGKRRRDDAGTFAAGNAAKMARFSSAATINLDNLTPRTMMLAKSQSFSVAAATGSEFRAAAALNRATSEQLIGTGQPLLSDLHKKKIFWATATALKTKKIGSQHANYKQYASVLAKVIKRFYLELPDRKSEGTSAAMLKIAEKHVFWVLQGRTEDEIYLNEKQRSDHGGVKLAKVTGYVAPEEYEQRKSLLMRSRSSASSTFGGTFSSASSLSTSFCGGSDSLFGSQPVVASQQSQQTVGLGAAMAGGSQLSQGSVTASQIAADVDFGALCTEHRLLLSASKASTAVQRLTTAEAGNSTSKSNTKTGVLRENDQRQRSAQKVSVSALPSMFSGRDQKNVSPFRVGSSSKLAACGGSMLATASAGAAISASVMKAKRQISFDS